MKALILFFTWMVMHPFHVSVCDIVHNKKAEAVQISYRIFQDDLENTLRVYHERPKFVLFQDSAETNTFIKEYFSANLSIAINEQATNMNYLGAEPEEAVIWCYLEIENIHDVVSMKVTNSMLTETFDDQQNITHFKMNGEKRSAILTRSKTTADYP